MIRGIVKGTEITIYDIFYEKKDKEGKILMTTIVIIIVKHDKNYSNKKTCISVAKA